jgi:hypothetical protein
MAGIQADDLLAKIEQMKAQKEELQRAREAAELVKKQRIADEQNKTLAGELAARLKDIRNAVEDEDDLEDDEFAAPQVINPVKQAEANQPAVVAPKEISKADQIRETINQKVKQAPAAHDDLLSQIRARGQQLRAAEVAPQAKVLVNPTPQKEAVKPPVVEKTVAAPVVEVAKKQQPAPSVQAKSNVVGKVDFNKVSHPYNKVGGNLANTYGVRPVPTPVLAPHQKKPAVQAAQTPVTPAKVAKPVEVVNRQAELAREEAAKAERARQEENARKAEQAELAARQQEAARRAAEQAELVRRQQEDASDRAAAKLQIEEETGVEIQLPENLSTATLLEIASDVAERAEKRLGFRQPKPAGFNQPQEDPAHLFMAAFMVGIYVQTSYSLVMTNMAVSFVAIEVQSIVISMQRNRLFPANPNSPFMNNGPAENAYKDTALSVGGDMPSPSYTRSSR